MKYNLIFFISLASSFINIKNYIIIPFNEINSLDESNFKDGEELLNKLSFLNLYSDFYLGNTPRKLFTLFRPNIDYFAITQNNEKDLISLISSNYYSPTSSDSLKVIEQNNKINLYNNKEQFIEATEIIHFLTNEDDISLIFSDKEKGKIDANKYKPYFYINFFCSDSKTLKHIGNFGLSYNNLNYPRYSFINELKIKSVINTAIWSVDFPDIDEDTYSKGNIIIGELPHIYNPKDYKKEDYYKSKLINNDTTNDWIIKIDYASILKNGEFSTSCKYINSISINFGVHMMYAPKKLFEQLKELYFDKLFDIGICDYKKIKIDKEKIIFIFCNENEFSISEKRKFPKIIFNIEEFGGNLELDYKDVFITINNKVVLMIAFSSKEIENTIKLGQIFLYKYKFTFDYDNKEIGFYRNNLKNGKIAHRIKRAFRGKKLLIFIILICIIGISYYLYKKSYIRKKTLIDFNKNIKHFTGDNIDQGYELNTDN